MWGLLTYTFIIRVPPFEHSRRVFLGTPNDCMYNNVIHSDDLYLRSVLHGPVSLN